MYCFLLRPSIAAAEADGQSGCQSHAKSIAKAVVLRRNRSVFIRYQEKGVAESISKGGIFWEHFTKVLLKKFWGQFLHTFLILGCDLQKGTY